MQSGFRGINRVGTTNLNFEKPSKRFMILGFIILVLCVSGLYLWLAQWDPIYRTIFVEEMNGGEAGRAAYLFGVWKGEGGDWQNAMAEPLGTFFTWLGLQVGGLSRFGMRLPFVVLGILAIIQFAVLVQKMSPGKYLFPLMVFLSLAISPFMLHIIPTGLNEAPFLFCIVTVLLVLQLEESRVFQTRQGLHKFLLAVACSLPVFVDQDGAIIPICCSLLILIRTFRGEISKRECALFFGAGALVAMLFGVLIMVWFGEKEITRMLEFRDALNAQADLSPGTVERLMRMGIFFPRNLNLYAPGLASLTLMGLACVYPLRKNLSPAMIFAMMIIVSYFLLSFIFPLIYWKRFIFYVPCCLVLILWAVTHIDHINLERRRTKIWFAVIFMAAAVLIFTTYLSNFNGMWRVSPFWVSDDWPRVRVLILPVMIIALILVWCGYAGKLMKSAFLFMCSASIIMGAFQITQPRQTQAYDIGEKIAELTSGQLIVADHQALRFFGYNSTSPVIFVHENDPAYPDKIYNDIESNQPEFIVVSDAYVMKSAVIAERFPNYRKVQKFQYTQLPTFFSGQPYVTDIFVYKKTHRKS